MLETNEQTNKWEKKRIGSNYIGQAADRCLFTGARAPVIQLLGDQSWWTV
jgi:hypothetical protein